MLRTQHIIAIADLLSNNTDFDICGLFLLIDTLKFQLFIIFILFFYASLILDVVTLNKLAEMEQK